ncbi:hypothetical protein Franean1_7169 [Parafrankia sp. EAN1pec]|uniref:LLM class flavin-dependent oxidoreductase n=1 Tax=Parafrankia sp. (strain EAN1pec) TaxID=298653 RepID=UPI00005422F3|nr:hypothetical protein Franean1_7169 [Frankia sp. EAN1pec]
MKLGIALPNAVPGAPGDAVTTWAHRAELVTNVLIAPQHRTALLAKQAASIDRASGGRLTLGVGVREDDFAACEIPFRSRGARLDRQLGWIAGTAATDEDAVARRVEEFTAAGPDHDPDLFWALRGGGGSFGVVTALEFRLYPITQVYAGVLFFPPLPELPPHLSGRSYVVVEAACQLSVGQADALLAPLRALEPELDTFPTHTGR